MRICVTILANVKLTSGMLFGLATGTRFRSFYNLRSSLLSRWHSREALCRRHQQQSSMILPLSSVLLKSYDSYHKSLSSLVQRSHPRLLTTKVEVLSLGNDADTKKSGTLTRIAPMNSMVRAGDIIATVLLPPQIESVKSDNNKASDDEKGRQVNEEEVSICAPLAGQVSEVFYQIRDTVKNGDCLMHIDDTIFQTEIQALKDQLKQISMTPQQEQKSELPGDYMERLLKIEDPLHLQSIVQYIPTYLWRQSLRLYERLVELQKEDPAELANTYTQMGVTLYNLGDLEMTLQHLHKALELREEALGSDNPQVAATCVHLSALYRKSGDFEKSLNYMLQAAKIQKMSLGEEHPVVASTYNNIGALHYQSNDFARAIREYEKALTIHLKNNGELHLSTAGTYHNLGVAWKHLGDVNTAQEYLQKALHIRQHHHEQRKLDTEVGKGEYKNDDNHFIDHDASVSAASDVVVSHTALGQLYSEMVNYEAAMEQYDAALVLQTQIFGSDSPMTATSHNNIGAFHYERGNYTEALKAYQTGLKIFRAKEPNHTDTAFSWNNVGLTHLKMGDADKALEQHQEALRILINLYGSKHPNLAMTIGSIGNVYKSQELWEKALTNYEVAHELLESALGTSHHPDVASSYNNMGLVLSQLPNREAEALEKYRAACESFGKSLGSEHPHCGSCRYNIALMLQSQGFKEDAKSEFEAARDIWATHFGPGHMHTQNAQNGVDECS